MNPQINISDSLMAKLKSVAEPFVDTPETVIARAIDFYVSSLKGSHGSSAPPRTDSGTGPIPFPGDAAPDLTFSRPVLIKIEGHAFEKKDLYWNTLLMRLVAIAGKRLPTAQVKQLILVNFVDGQGDANKGFRYVPEAKLSVQAQDANAAWRACFHLVKALNLSIEVMWLWENKDKASHPGRTGVIKHNGA